MRGYEGDGFRIDMRWKEEVVYWEDGQGFLLDAGWGVDPPVLYVPAAARWDVAVPSWLRGRRDEVLARLREHSGHDLVESERGYDGRDFALRVRGAGNR